jgi:hypothetical protein
MTIKDFIDPTLFSDPKGALDMYGNSLRQAMRFDVFDGKTVFEAIVLSKPIFLADAQLSSADSPFSQVSAEEGRLQKFSFKGRIIDSPSPHDFIPDPCNMNDASDERSRKKIIRVANLHTTFISSDDYTRTNSTLPNVGDKVRVELTRNVHSYNLQYGKFLGVASNLVGPDVPKTEQCISARLAFGVGVPGAIPADKEGQRALAKEYLRQLRDEQEARGEGRWATGTDDTGETVELTKCGGKGDFPLADCKEFTIAGSKVKLHPKFGEYIKKAVDDAIAAGVVTSSGVSPGGGRLTETQIYLRIRYKCGDNYTEIMNLCSSCKSAKCTTPAAQPTKSNHEAGLAVDLSGVLTTDGTEAAMKEGSKARNSAFYKWMVKNVHNKSKYGRIKGWLAKEPWHWSYSGG